MRIALIHNLSTGGGKRHLCEQARELVSRGHTLELFAPASAAAGAEGGEYLPLAPLCAQAHRYGPAPAAGAVQTGGVASDVPPRRRWERLKALPPVGAVADALWAARSERRLSALGRLYAAMAHDIDAGEFDVAYVGQCVLTLAPDLLRHLRRTPSVFCCNDTQRSAMEWPPETAPGYDAAGSRLLRRARRGRLLSPAQARFAEGLERCFVANTRAANIVLANSWYTREALARGAGVNARVVYPGVDTAFFCPAAPNDRRERSVLSVGALLPGKRHEFVLEAVAAIPPEAPRPRLEIIGYEGGPRADALERDLRARAADRGVKLTVRRDVGDDALREAYRRAAVVAFAPYLEPFGLVAVEAMACGTPVVGVREAGVRETVRDGETGFLTALDPREFGQAIRCLLDDPARARRMGDAARRIAETEWTWRRSTDRLEPILAEAAAAG